MYHTFNAIIGRRSEFMFDFKEIKIDKSSSESLHLQLKNALFRLFRQQQPDAAAPLPSERALCTALGIHRATVHKVYAELEEAGIVERGHGRSLFLRRSARKKLEGNVLSIGVLLPFLFSEYTSNWQRLQYLQGIMDRAAFRGYAVSILQLPPHDASQTEIEDFIDLRISNLSGLIHLGNRLFIHDAALEGVCRYTGIPQVSVSGTMVGFPHIGSVNSSFDKAVSDLIEHLKTCGVRTCGIWENLSPYVKTKPEFHYAARDRSTLLKMQLEENGFVIPENWFLRGNSFDEIVLPRLKKEKLPDFIWCSDDDSSIKIWEYCRRAGIRVPQDLKLAGFDGSRLLPVALATFRKPFREIGEAAVDMLLEHFEHGVNEKNRVQNLEAEFFSGETLFISRTKNPTANKHIKEAGIYEKTFI